MTKVEFCEKHGEYLPAEMLKTTDVLMRVASNLSDTQEMLDRGMDVNQHLNEVKKYIFDFMTVLRRQEQYKKYEEQEMNEFNEHLGKF
jgi:hypothetical protein